MVKNNPLARVFRWTVEPSMVYWASVGIMAAYLRREYVQRAQALDDKTVANQLDSAQVAAIINQRNQLKNEIREAGNDLIERLAERRNQQKYGNELGPDYNYLYQKQQQKHPDWRPEQIRAEMVAGATRTNEAANEGAQTLELVGYGLLAALLLRLCVAVWRAGKGEGLLVGFQVVSCWVAGFLGAMTGLVLVVESAADDKLVWAGSLGAALGGLLLVAVWDLIFGWFVGRLNRDLSAMREKRGF